MKKIEETLKVRANQNKRTFTIRKQFNGKTIAKYRTNTLSPDEFGELEYNTSNDWKDFLNISNNYYTVK